MSDSFENSRIGQIDTQWRNAGDFVLHFNLEEGTVPMNQHSNYITDLSNGPILSQLVYFSFPLLLGNLFQQLYNSMDFLIVGRVCGNAAQAAVSASTSIVNLLISFTQGFAVGAGIVISLHFGAKTYDQMRSSIHTAVVLGTGLGMLVTIMGFVFSHPILTMIKTPPEALEEATAYFQILSIGLFFMVMYNVGSGIFRALGDNRHPLYSLILSVILNTILDLILVAGFHMGVRGAAFATIIAQGASVASEYLVLFRTDDSYRLNWSELRVDVKQLRTILENAFPSAVQNCIVSLSNVVVQANINQFGELAMAGFGSYTKLASFAVLPATSMSLSLTTFVGQNRGAQHYSRTKKGVQYGLVLISTITMVIGLGMVVFARPLIGLFNSDPAVIKYGIMMCRRAGPFLIFLGLSHALTGALRGAGYAKIPLAVLTVSWCLIRVIWILGLSLVWNDIRIIYWSYPITWLCSTGVLFVFYPKICSAMDTYDNRDKIDNMDVEASPRNVETPSAPNGSPPAAESHRTEYQRRF
ncbi:MAG: MATE family efflux transporter [Lawsonibacter sp.]|nr:MATE family efflux transporter [Lawsonibacter sp.]